jgi:Bacteriophage HK97-gp10, putative tail-component
MADLKDFAERINRIAVRVEEGGDDVVRKAAMAVDQAVVSATPVDTGRARSNWIAGVDHAPEGTVEPHVPGKDGATGAQNTEASIAAATQVIAGYDGDTNAEIHITNNLPYIGELNRGSSAQAPAHYVEDGVRAAVEVIQGTRILGDDD